MRKTQAVTARIASTAPWFALFLLALVYGACSSSRTAGTAVSNAGDSVERLPDRDEHETGPAFDIFRDLPGQLSQNLDEPLQWRTNEPIVWDHAPLGRNDSERIIFSHLYETLFDWTERGPRPSLAESATSHDGGKVWEIRIRPDLRFSDGSQLRASDVLTSWRMAKERLTEDPAERNGLPWVLLPAPVRRVADLSFEITLPFPVPDLPRVLCHPGLAVAVPRPEHAHLVGTGPYMVSPGSYSTGEGSLLVIRLFPNLEARRVGARVVLCMIRRGGGARIGVSSQADVVITRDRSTRDYAAGLGWTAVELPLRFRSQEVCVFVARSTLSGLAGDREPFANPQTHGWQGLHCGIWPPAPWIRRSGVLEQTLEHWRTQGLPAISKPQLVFDYEGENEEARAWAERFAALLSSSSRQVFAQGLPPWSLPAAARRGTELGYVVSIHPLWDDPCWTLAEVWLRFPWLPTQAGAQVWRLPSTDSTAPVLLVRPHVDVEDSP